MNAPAPKRPRSANARPVDFDLDALDVQPDEPLTIKAKGKKFRLINIRDLDWQVAARLQQSGMYDLFDNIVPEEDREAFMSLSLTDKEMTAIAEFYKRHFGDLVGDEGESGA